MVFSNCKVADLDQHEGNQACTYGETPLGYSVTINFSINILQILDYQDFDARIKVNSFKNIPSSTGAQLLTDVLLDELKPEVEEEKEIEFRQN